MSVDAKDRVAGEVYSGAVEMVVVGSVLRCLTLGAKMRGNDR